MAEATPGWRSATVAVVFVLGVGLGWLGASRQAMLDNRARDVAGFEAMRQRVDAEYMRRLDLSEAQRKHFMAVWDEAHREMNLAMSRMRPEFDGLMQRIDERVRPILSPRQLAVYDRLESERRSQLPPRPADGD